MTVLGPGTYTFGRSIAAGTYDITYASGNGVIGIDPDLDIEDAPYLQFYDNKWSTIRDDGNPVFPRGIHLEALKGLRMIITGDLCVNISKSTMIQPD